MAVKTETRTIGEHTYRVTQLTALKSRELFVRLVQLLGPAAASALGGGKKLSSIDVGELLSDLATRINDVDLGHFCDVLGSCTEIVGANGQTERLDRTLLDMHFAGALLNMFKWLAFALEVNFADFLSVWRRIQVVASMAQPSPASASHAGSTGTSIAS